MELGFDVAVALDVPGSPPMLLLELLLELVLGELVDDELLELLPEDDGEDDDADPVEDESAFFRTSFTRPSSSLRSWSARFDPLLVATTSRRPLAPEICMSMSSFLPSRVLTVPKVSVASVLASSFLLETLTLLVRTWTLKFAHLSILPSMSLRSCCASGP